jgi:hypothetical protein
VRPTHLLDRDLLAVWSGRPADVQPKPLTPRKPAHHRALPLVSSAVDAARAAGETE